MIAVAFGLKDKNDVELTWLEVGKDDRGRLIGGDVMAVCDFEPVYEDDKLITRGCTNTIHRGILNACEEQHQTGHCGRYFCATHLSVKAHG